MLAFLCCEFSVKIQMSCGHVYTPAFLNEISRYSWCHWPPGSKMLKYVAGSCIVLILVYLDVLFAFSSAKISSTWFRETRSVGIRTSPHAVSFDCIGAHWLIDNQRHDGEKTVEGLLIAAVLLMPVLGFGVENGRIGVRGGQMRCSWCRHMTHGANPFSDGWD